MRLTKALIIPALLLVLAGILNFNEAKAEDVTVNLGQMQCTRHGVGDYKRCRDSYSQGGWERQVWGFSGAGTDYEGYGITSDQRITTCLSNLVGTLLNGPCIGQIQIQNDTYGARVPWPNQASLDRNIDPNNYWDDFDYVVTELEVKDATIYYQKITKERALRTFYLDDQGVGTDGIFQVNWDVETAVGGVTLDWSGPVSQSGPVPVPEDGDFTLNCTDAGPVQFWLTAKGPVEFGGDPDEIILTHTVNCIEAGSPPGNFNVTGASCFNWPTPEIEVNFNPSSGAATYYLQRSVNGGGWAVIYSGNYGDLDRFSDLAITVGSNYSYRVQSENGFGTNMSNASAPITVSEANCGGTPPPPPPPIVPPPPPAGTCTENALLEFVTPPPANIGVGQAYSFRIRLTNTGNVKYAHGTWWRLQDQGTAASYYSNGGSFANLPMQNTGANEPGDFVEHVITGIAPASTGPYTIGMQMYHIRSVAGYDTTQNPSCSPALGADHYFGTNLTRNINVVNLGSITVNSRNAAGAAFGGGWTIQGPGLSDVMSVPSTNKPYPNLVPGNYELYPTAIPGYSAAISTPSPHALAAGQNLTWNITYTAFSGNVSASANIGNAGAGWSVIRVSDGATVASGLGTAAQNLSLPIGNYTFNVNNIAGWEEYVRVNGGGINNATPYAFSVANGSSVTLLAYYTQPPPIAPSNISLETSPCGQLTISWTDNSNNETGYAVYWRNAANGGDNLIQTNLPAIPGVGSKGYYTWTTPPMAPRWLSVASFIDYAGTPIYSNPTVSSSSYTPITCFADFSSSSKRVYQVNGAAYNPSTVGKDGDIITFRLIIQNNGTTAATITSISDIFHPNPVNDGSPVQLVAPGAVAPIPGCANAIGAWYLCVDKDADGVYNEAGEVMSVSGVSPNLTIAPAAGNFGTKCTTSNNTNCAPATDPSCSLAPAYCNNWVVMFTAKVQTTVPDVSTEIWNEAVLNFTAGPATRLLTPRYLINTSRARAPIFREVAP